MDEFKAATDHGDWQSEQVRTENGLSVRLSTWQVRHINPPRPSRRILMLGGSRDHAEIYSYLGVRFAKAGLGLTYLDWPGHGRSDHLPGAGDLEYVHTNNFAKELLPAMATALKLVQPDGVLAHSMGAGLALGYYGQHGTKTPLTVTAPFMDLARRHGPRWLTEYGVKAACLLGMRGELAKGQTLFKRDPFEGNGLTSDEAAFAHRYNCLATPGFIRGGVTYGYVNAFQEFRNKYLTEAALARIKAPVLAILTPNDEVVSGPAQQKLRVIPQATIVELPHSRHEPLRERPEIRDPVIQRVCDFYQKPL